MFMVCYYVLITCYGSQSDLFYSIPKHDEPGNVKEKNGAYNGENLVVGRLETSRSCLIQGQGLSKSGVRGIQRDAGIGIF